MKVITLLRYFVLFAVCLPFSMEGKTDGSADDLQAHLYDHFKGDLRCLPHTEDTLMQHVLRAFIQIITSKSAHLSPQNIPDHAEYG